MYKQRKDASLRLAMAVIAGLICLVAVCAWIEAGYHTAHSPGLAEEISEVETQPAPLKLTEQLSE